MGEASVLPMDQTSFREKNMTEQELERAIQEVWTLFKDTDKKIQETDRIVKEMGRKI